MVFQFKEEMIKHSSKVKVDDLQGLILVTLVVASATDERNELSEESQVNRKCQKKPKP